MKLRVTELECDANELRQSNTLADSLANLLRGTFNRNCASVKTEDESDDDSL